MDVEFITDHDTDDALLQWCARRRREVIPSRYFVPAVALFVLVEWKLVWHLGSEGSPVVWFAVLMQVGAFAFGVVVRNPNRPTPFAFPHAELASLGVFIASLIVTFADQPSVPAFLLLAIILTVTTALAAVNWHSFGFVRDWLPFYGRAEVADRRAAARVQHERAVGSLSRDGGGSGGAGPQVVGARADLEACPPPENAPSVNGFARGRITPSCSKVSPKQCVRTLRGAPAVRRREPPAAR